MSDRFFRIVFFICGMTLWSIPFNLTAGSMPSEISLDYAFHNPLSLVMKRYGWLEKEFQAEGVPIRWVFSSGGSRSLNNLRENRIDFASSSGLSAVRFRANGDPFKVVYMFAQPESVMLLVSRDSPINAVMELKGKKIAASPGTNPYYFLLSALNDAGLRLSDVSIIPLSHTNGRIALERHNVDAWAAIDPYCASCQMERGARAIYRNKALNYFGFLSTTESFAASYPEAVARVIRVYERVRKWALKHPDELEILYADEAKISLPVARLVMSRIDLSSCTPDATVLDILKKAASLLEAENLVPKGISVNRVVEELVDTSYLPKR